MTTGGDEAMADRSWGSDDWLADREQHRADEDAEARHYATHDEPVADCGWCDDEEEED